MTSELAKHTAVGLSARLGDGRLTAREVTADLLLRINKREPAVRAWAHLDAGLANRQADAADVMEPLGPLHGLPVGVKDIIDTADQPTENGSPLQAGRQPVEDAAVVTLLREAGAVVMGKTVTTEFALFHPGPTTNPHDPARTPGGSSSGSAAAVAAGMVPLALGTQTAGSIVRPASFCGVAGWKPTFGTLPLDGVLAVSPSLDTLGVLARTVGDLILFAQALAGVGTRDGVGTAAEPHVDPAGDATPPRLGFARTAEWARLEPSTQAALSDMAARLGLPVVDLPAEFDALPAAQEVVMAHEAALALAPHRELGPVSDQLAALLDHGLAVPRRDMDAALDLAARCVGRLSDVLVQAGVDAFVAPAVIGEAPIGLDATGDPICCRAWTLLGVPCVAVPGLIGPAGMPLGVQVIAAHGDDAIALAAAGGLEAALAARPEAHR